MSRWFLALAPLLALLPPPAGASHPTPSSEDAASSPNVGKVRRSAVRGVSWLVRAQAKDGGWSDGTERTKQSEVAVTAFATLALLRYDRRHSAIPSAVDFVIRSVEEAPPGPGLATPQGTQIQRKLGTYVDTHLAMLLLSEALPTLSEPLRARAAQAIGTAVQKTSQAQSPDGGFDQRGWAPVLSSALAAQGLHSVARAGHAELDRDMLARSDAFQLSQVSFDQATLVARRGANVNLYAAAAALRGNHDTMQRAGELAADARSAALASAARGLALEAVVEDDGGQVLRGYGSLGGEEMLSYAMISDTLVEIDGGLFSPWDDKVSEGLQQAQKADGSWVGHHCITSPVFTTAGAVLTLLAAPKE
ncbi:MAG: hypothetical protein KTR31_21280 [Myxococcales bacterium]|nr:hypothetical protein [Myxococcales bacterium]